jgi:hypothetical protein
VSRSTPCFVALCAASALFVGCSRSAPDHVATAKAPDLGPTAASSTSAPTPVTASTTTPASIAALADRLARSIPDDVFWCENIIAGKYTDSGRPELDRGAEHVTSGATPEQARTALEALLRDGRFGSVPWDRAVLAQADVGPEIPGAVALALEFDAPVSVPSTLGIVDEPSEGEVRVTTRGGYPKTRKPTAHERERFEKAHEVGVVVDLASRSVRILSVSEPVFCRVGHPEGWSK